MTEFTRTCHCCGSKDFSYDKKLKQHICNYCKTSYEKTKTEPDPEEPTLKDFLLALGFILAILAGIVIGIIAIIKVAHSQKTSEPAVQQPAAQEVSIEQTPEIPVDQPEIQDISEDEDTDENVASEAQKFIEHMLHLLAIPLMLMIVLATLRIAGNVIAGDTRR